MKAAQLALSAVAAVAGVGLLVLSIVSLAVSKN